MTKTPPRHGATIAWQNAAVTIGEIGKGYSQYFLTHGQFSMVDTIDHICSQHRECAVSLWTWPSDKYEGLFRLFSHSNIKTARVVMDFTAKSPDARERNKKIATQWQARFGLQSVLSCNVHAKIASVETPDGLRFAVRGSLNLNINDRMEQLDISEGAEPFGVIRRMENTLRTVPEQTSPAIVSPFSQLTLFHAPTWKPNRKEIV